MYGKASLPDLGAEISGPLVPETRESLVRRVAEARKRLATCTSLSERKRIGREINSINLQINTYRSKTDADEVDRFFVSAAKKLLSPAQFKKIMDEASRNWKLAEQAGSIAPHND